jgi:hypothetical protein
MAVPKKRKKLEDAIESLPNFESNKEFSADSENFQKQKKTNKVIKNKQDKVDKAFDVVDQIENPETRTNALKVQKINEPSDQGIHIQFKLDLIRLEDILEIGKQKEDKVENSIVLDFTIPYFWNLPIINEVTKTFIQELKNLKIIQ